MKQFKDKEKQNKFQALLQGRTRVSYKLLQELENLGMIEDYDLFRVISNQFDDMYMFYMDGEYQLIDRNKKDFKQVNRELLQTRCYEIQPNRIQEFIKANGIESFYDLSTVEFIEVLLSYRDNLLIDNER